MTYDDFAKTVKNTILVGGDTSITVSRYEWDKYRLTYRGDVVEITKQDERLVKVFWTDNICRLMNMMTEEEFLKYILMIMKRKN